MKFQLKCILIETKPRTGYYIANEGSLVTITKMDVKNGFCKLSNGNKITIDQAKFCVAKLIGEVNIDDKPYTYSIIHGDYPILMADINRPVEYTDNVPEEDRIYKNYAEALIDGKSVECTGDFEIIFSKTQPNEVVEITNINIIDKFNLYDKVNRIGVVTDYNKVKQTFTINLNNSDRDKPLVCQRKDFKKIHDENTITMLRVYCPHCKRYGH